MAKIDVTQIEGYAEMSAEDKLKALEGFDIPDPDYSGYVRRTFSIRPLPSWLVSRNSSRTK